MTKYKIELRSLFCLFQDSYLCHYSKNFQQQKSAKVINFDTLLVVVFLLLNRGRKKNLLHYLK